MSLIVAARLTTFPAAESAADSLFSAGFVEEDDRARIGTLAAEPLGGLRSDARTGLRNAPPEFRAVQTNAARGMAPRAAFFHCTFLLFRYSGGRCAWRAPPITAITAMTEPLAAPIRVCTAESAPAGSLVFFFIVQVVFEIVFVVEHDTAHADARILVRVGLARGVFVRGVILSDHWQLHEES